MKKERRQKKTFSSQYTLRRYIQHSYKLNFQFFFALLLSLSPLHLCVCVINVFVVMKKHEIKINQHLFALSIITYIDRQRSGYSGCCGCDCGGDSIVVVSVVVVRRWNGKQSISACLERACKNKWFNAMPDNDDDDDDDDGNADDGYRPHRV